MGQFDRFTPKFVKQYANIHEIVLGAIESYKDEVENKVFPADEHSTEMKAEQWQALLDALEGGS